MTDVEDTKKPKHTVHAFDPTQFNPEDDDGVEDTTWAEVCRSCWCHSPAAWGMICFRLFWVLFFLYFFILGLEIMGDGAQVMTGCIAGELFSDDTNPLAGVMVGILITVCMQSSSTTTSITVSLVAAGVIGVEAGIYIIMGANIGTSVTNTIVAMGQMGEGDQLERAFAGATVHDLFNYLTVAILLPVEVITGYLARLTAACVKNASTNPDGETRENFIGKYIEPLGRLLIRSNRSVVTAVTKGGSCDDFYPIQCEDPSNPTKDTCPQIGLIGCSSDEGKPCPIMFDPFGTSNSDAMSGAVAFLLGIVLLFGCLGGLVFVLNNMLLGASTRVIYKATDINGYLAMIIGCGLTVAVQSSSVTTSTLTPLVGMGLIRLEQMYPITLGANIGTTITGLMSALVSEGTEGLQVALAHLFFNVTGILIWYPIPFMRNVPMHGARQLGKATRVWRGFPILYLLIMFLLLPGGLLALSTMFSTKKTGLVVGASIITVILIVGLICLIYWWRWREGRLAVGTFFANRQKRLDALETLPYDIVWAQRKIKQLQEHTACDAAPSPTVSASTEDAWVNVADEMDHVLAMVKALMSHTGLPAEEGDEDKALGRFVHKEKEVMPDVDTSGYWNYQAMVLGVSAVILAFILWGIGASIARGSIGYKALGYFILSLLLLFIIYRLYSFFVNDGKKNSLLRYKHMELKKQCKETYPSALAQINADIRTLAAHTDLPSLESNAAEPDAVPDTEGKDEKAENNGESAEEQA